MEARLEDKMQNDNVDELAKLIKIQIQLSMTNIVSAGALLRKVQVSFKEDSAFDAWVKKNIGNSFVSIVHKLIKWHEAVKDMHETMPLISPVAFIALAHDDVSIEDLRKIAMTGEVKMDKMTKNVQDISTRDISKVVLENKVLKGLLSQRDLDLKRLESESANLQTQINNAPGGQDSNKCKKLQRKLSQTHDEIAKLRESLANIEPATERLRSIAEFQEKLDLALTSSAARFLKLRSSELKEDEKINLASSMSMHATMLSDFKEKIGI